MISFSVDGSAAMTRGDRPPIMVIEDEISIQNDRGFKLGDDTDSDSFDPILNVELGEYSSATIKLSDTDKWTIEDESKFTKLAVKDAVGELGPEDIKVFRRLQRRRFELCANRSAEDILSDYRKEKALTEVINSLNKYVSIFNIKG